ncbi:hypothetical protein SYNPS1DRAFT_29208 [Syncephalis pseudoplumigaleata]|uniref:F-box domain-containing protein n=1 Tax=Syncephalis pseudoplumigaleata TaxID=1712513 RepID=A0A4P9YYN8_9FUNG|nr:hypothetical protein SYNPS1DRAFT_29208 [Syncephalis pseudoplumigaleata]|eukprot:RKP25045.1 hypothetical protein SYNPS1DRAFT_29208 [Syncephalis pseudoplumigaleata]
MSVSEPTGSALSYGGLPPDVLRIIFSYADINSRDEAQWVNQTWHGLIDTEPTWRARFFRDLRNYLLLQTFPKAQTWRTEYIAIRKRLRRLRTGTWQSNAFASNIPRPISDLWCDFSTGCIIVGSKEAGHAVSQFWV